MIFSSESNSLQTMGFKLMDVLYFLLKEQFKILGHLDLFVSAAFDALIFFIK